MPLGVTGRQDGEDHTGEKTMGEQVKGENLDKTTIILERKQSPTGEL